MLGEHSRPELVPWVKQWVQRPEPGNLAPAAWTKHGMRIHEARALQNPSTIPNATAAARSRCDIGTRVAANIQRTWADSRVQVSDYFVDA